MKLFVTGGAGRLGGEIVPRLRRAGWAVVAPTRDELNLLDEPALADTLATHAPDVILHLAAYTDVAGAERNREACWAANVVVSRLVARHTPGRLLHVSTDYVFDGERGGYSETDPPHPSNYYSLTKLVGEEAARAARDALVVRLGFKEAVWPHPVAFDDQFTSADYTDVIASQLLVLLAHLDRVRPADGLLHLGSERKSVYDLARRRNPAVRAGSRLGVGVHIPPDVSLDTLRWRTIRASLEADPTAVSTAVSAGSTP